MITQNVVFVGPHDDGRQMQIVSIPVSCSSSNRRRRHHHYRGTTVRRSFDWSCEAIRTVALLLVTIAIRRARSSCCQRGGCGFTFAQAWINSNNNNNNNCRLYNSRALHRIANLQRNSVVPSTVLAWSSSSSSSFHPLTFTTGNCLRQSRIFSTITTTTMAQSPSTTSSSSSLAQNIDGKVIAAAIQDEIKRDAQQLFESHRVTPGLAVILVGQRRDSQTYVHMKKKACAQVGFASFGFDYNDQVTQDELVEKVQELNRDPMVHGILIQLPLPRHIHEPTVLHAILPSKDVDGLHPLNVAALSSMATHDASSADDDNSVRRLDWTDLNSIPFPIACTPQGCIELLDRSGVEIAGQHAVVVGRSNLVGLPMSLLLLHRNATVTIVHSKTKDAPRVVQQADIVIAAVGRPGLITKDWFKPGSVVIDVGINSVEAPDTKKGYRLVGDVDFAGAQQVCSKITPVPGGVGPMTIAMLLRNTLNACKRSLE